MVHLSEEQEQFIRSALEGNNILVEACIGSGKTTSIQELCNRLPRTKRILYLTYNRLLKADAKTKILNTNVTVTNYHGFVYPYLRRAGIQCGISDSISKFTEARLPIPSFDILIIDEYQDIELDFANMLNYLKETNPNMQLIMVGDMSQKIYDKTTLDIENWAQSFLGEHLELEFSLCFRLQPKLAKKIGSIWEKKITGVNKDCKVCSMPPEQVVKFLAKQDPKDVLCLGAKTGQLSKVLNKLESKYPEKFNKNTVYATIKERDANIEPNNDSAIFTTFDSSKGMEKPICIVFDWDTSYWGTRVNQPQTNQNILKNIFLVAASRGKEKIIFVESEYQLLNKRIIDTPAKKNPLIETYVSEMFDFKYVEDIQVLMKMLDLKKVPQEDNSIINIPNSDGLIDLSPCIGIYQEASYFNHYDIQKQLELSLKKRKFKIQDTSNLNISQKILKIVALDTHQNRYYTQVETPFVSEDLQQQIENRLSTHLSRDENVQNSMDYSLYGVDIKGACDVYRKKNIWELKFTQDLRPEHFLQLAMYLLMSGKEKGTLWNVRTNEMYRIRIKEDRQLFAKQVYKTINKMTVPQRIREDGLKR